MCSVSIINCKLMYMKYAVLYVGKTVLFVNAKENRLFIKKETKLSILKNLKNRLRRNT